jgi:hypothetical protein
MFPEQSLKTDAVLPLVTDMMTLAKRSLVLVPSDKSASTFRDFVKTTLKYPVFDAKDIEASKTVFTNEPKAVAILANRYDGIDLIGNECRLLFIEGLPKASNIQERFLMSRMGAGTLLDDRIRTRIIQAVGRCTRSATDYAAVVVLGDDFYDWMILDEKRRLFHPELQAELRFGSAQSVDKTHNDFVENLSIFLKHREEWDEVDAEILDLREEAKQQPITGESLLLASAAKEVDYQYAIWDHDYERASLLAQEIAGMLSGDDTKGFRGFWYYLSGSASLLAAESLNRKHLIETAKDLFGKAAACASAVPWMRALAANGSETEEEKYEHDAFLQANVERLELIFEQRGYASPRRFEADAKQILDGLSQSKSDTFEESHRRLGEMLGFEGGNSSSNAAPDPWWISGGQLCIVAEDKSDAKPENPIAVKHARQASGHPKWITENIELRVPSTIISVMITPATTIDAEAITFAEDVTYWPLDEFRSWATQALGVVRTLRAEYAGPGNLAWRARVADAFRKAHLDPKSIVKKLNERNIRDLPKTGGTNSEE